MLSKKQFKKLRADVKGMRGFGFTALCITALHELYEYVRRTFAGTTPLSWLYDRNIEPTVEQYREYCVRWLDSVEHLICTR
jgi:hypothetical protein